ncbi:MAG: DUF4129 domain-containing protein [Thermoleophilaceae bacterium]|nr:DUF4129 domain-containing protein [Thermoleophilaceae bacterium]
MARTVAVAVVVTLLVCVVAIGGREPLRGPVDESTEALQAPERAAEGAPPRSGPLPPEVFVLYEEEGFTLPAWVPLMLAGVVAMGILVAGVLHVRGVRLWRFRWWRRRRAPRRQPGAAATEPTVGIDDDAEVARRAVEAALEPLRDPADPRAAVIAAYARMEQVLAERELGRRAPEAPREYLARVLREHGMPERSLTTLTALFEEARFSLHPISHSARRRALSALENARLGLRAPGGEERRL